MVTYNFVPALLTSERKRILLGESGGWPVHAPVQYIVLHKVNIRKQLHLYIYTP
jgi:hypothetical protein